MTVYVDSNYWIYWMDSRHPEHECVTHAMRDAIREGIILNLATFIEVAHYFRGLGDPEFTSRMGNLRNLKTLTLAELDMTTADQAIRFLARYGKHEGIGGRDAVVLATMQLNGVKRILTHDKDFKKIKGIKVVDPIPSQP